MRSSSWGRARRGSAALGFILLLFTANLALADTVTLTPQKSVYARDGGLNADPVVDGQFDAVYNGATVYVWRQVQDGVQREYRTGFDFQLPPVVMQAGTTIVSATLHIETTSETVGSADVITVHGIPGSAAPFVVDDFEVSNPVATVAIQPSNSWPAARDFQVASRIQSLVGNSNDHASFTLAAAQWGTLLAWKPNATLTIEYTPASANPPALTILAPATGSTVLQADPVTFEATASDVEDGDLTAAIQWTSSKNGPIGGGGSFVTNTLSAGTHVITATVHDVAGNTTSKTINLTVQSTSNTPPTISVLAPAEGSTFAKGTPINFQAIASDAEDGDRTPNIQWTSNINGAIGSGGSFSSSTLYVGTHQIVATVYDTAGNSASALVNVIVQAPANTAPSVSITSPANGASLTAGASFNLLGSANDAEQGTISSSLQWILDGVTTLASGANASAVISTPGAHTITARVTDSGGLIGEQIVNVNVVNAPPPPSSYCSLRATTSTYEWIGAVKAGNVNNVSGNNGGYRDYTSVQFNLVTGSANSIVLTPGFSGGAYTERWSVWIDLNRDRTFSANEQLLSATTASAVSMALTIPTGTASGATRMRVVMSYGSTPPTCGTFSYGEVEDYTVDIQSSGSPPPSGPTYCASRGTSSATEFIQQIVVNGTTRTTGNNSGYADFTSSAPIPLVRGSNLLTLTPGFASSSYAEQWMVWIDFNKDGVFGNEDWVLGNGGSSTVSGNANVPTSAASGITRMRVQMKYGSAATPCETFNYGEVEDYAVQIP